MNPCRARSTSAKRPSRPTEGLAINERGKKNKEQSEKKRKVLL